MIAKFIEGDITWKEALKYVAIIVASVCVLYTAKSIAVSFVDNSVPTKDYETTITQEDISNTLKETTTGTDKQMTEKELTNTTKIVYKEIESARNNETTPIYTTSEKITANEASKLDVVKKENPTTVVSEPSTSHDGTNVYSISVKKAQHGVGIYLGWRDASTEDKKNNYEAGIHYRNKRWVYQAGVDGKGKFNGRVAYELAQW